MDKNKPFCMGIFLYTFKGIFKPTINNLIKSGNIKELVFVSIYPPSIKSYNKVIQALVNFDVDQAVEEFIDAIRKLPNQKKYSWVSGSHKIILTPTPTGIFLHNITLSLSMLGESAAIALIECLQDKNHRIREVSADALGRMKEKRAVLLLSECLNDNNKDVRLTAIDALGNIGGKKSVVALINWIKNENEKLDNRFNFGVNNLIKIGKLAVIPLISCLKDKSANVRILAARALGEIGHDNKDVIAALTDLLSDKNKNSYGNNVCKAASEALEKIRNHVNN
jgi:hypothetical protein